MGIHRLLITLNFVLQYLLVRLIESLGGGVLPAVSFLDFVTPVIFILLLNLLLGWADNPSSSVLLLLRIGCVFLNAKGIARPFQLDYPVVAQVVQHVLVDELVLAHTLHHEVSLFSESPDNAKYGYPGRVICVLHTGRRARPLVLLHFSGRVRVRGVFWGLAHTNNILTMRVLQYLQRLYDIVYRNYGARATDAGATVDYDFAARWTGSFNIALNTRFLNV